ncbi:MAG: hypothetical protein ACLGGX_07675, partial [Bdellovibrionia bacterium]
MHSAWHHYRNIGDFEVPMMKHLKRSLVFLLLCPLTAFSFALPTPGIHYTHLLPLKIHVPENTSQVFLQTEIAAIQSYLDQCEILVDVAYEKYETSNENDWETVWFNNY